MAATKLKHRKTSKGVQVRQKNLSTIIENINAQYVRNDLPDYKAGDTLKVHVRIKEGDKERIQIYEGLVIKKANRGVHRSFTVRKISHGVGVERIFLESSQRIAKVEKVSIGKVRRAKLYYIRELSGKAARVQTVQKS
jgi:large subunit ribosomal protein L19